MRKIIVSSIKCSLFVAMMAFTFSLTSQSIEGADGSCTISIQCSPQPADKIECTSDNNDCVRKSKISAVICDGVTTTCNP